MTLSQRLVRAGLTFSILGTVAAALPQHDAARATPDCQTCPKVSLCYRLTGNSCGNETFLTLTKSGCPVSVYAFTSKNNGPFLKTSAAYTYTGSTASGKAFASPGYSTTGNPTKGGFVKGSFAVTGGPNYIVQYPVVVLSQ